MRIQSSWKTTVLAPDSRAFTIDGISRSTGLGASSVSHTGSPVPSSRSTLRWWNTWLAFQARSNGFAGVACRANVHDIGRRLSKWSAKRMRSTVSRSPGISSTTRLGSSLMNSSPLSQYQHSPFSSLPTHTDGRNGQLIGPCTPPALSTLPQARGNVTRSVANSGLSGISSQSLETERTGSLRVGTAVTVTFTIPSYSTRETASTMTTWDSCHDATVALSASFSSIQLPPRDHTASVAFVPAARKRIGPARISSPADVIDTGIACSANV